MNLATMILTQSAADAFADKAIEWIFAVAIVIAVVIGVIRWLGDIFD